MELIKRLRVQAHENPVSLADLLSLCREAADAIENLQTENAALRRQIDNLTSANAVMVKEFDKKLEELDQLKVVCDAAIADLHGRCDICAYLDTHPDCECECPSCSLGCMCRDCLDGSNFEWIGLRKEE